ncbi:DUF4139 domain-containing protein, partial [bacterium]
FALVAAAPGGHKGEKKGSAVNLHRDMIGGREALGQPFASKLDEPWEVEAALTLHVMRNHLAIPLAVLASATVYGCSVSQAQMAKKEDALKRASVELTVYAQDFGMVRETRKVELSEGKTRVGLLGVSKSLDQDSVVFAWPGTKDARVLSSTYDLGVNDSGRLLNRFLGQRVELVYRGQNGEEAERVAGTLEVAEAGNIVVKVGEKYVVNPDATIEAPANAGIVTIPQLSAEVESKSGGNTDLAMTYMTEGLSWNADYTATLAPGKETLEMECWATVTNKTGTDFPDAKISFVAGSPNRAVKAKQRFRDGDYAGANRSPQASAEPEAQEARPQAMGELYAYPYKSTATIRQDQMNRVRMMGSDSVEVKRVYSIALPYVYRDYGSFVPDQRLTATMGINFVNAEKSGLGLPLPAGAVRVYEPDADGSPRYIGAATLGDTPKDARVSLELTNVFDVYAQARQVSAQRLDKRRTRRSIEVTVTNEKSQPVEVRLVQYLGGPWKIENETHKSGKLNAGTNQWEVMVPAGGETKLRYSVIFGK